MIFIDNYEIFERKNYQLLYHIIDMNKLLFILENNKLESFNFSFISTTRNKMMNGYLGDSPVSIFKLELDGEKLSDNYMIKPFAETYFEGPERIQKRFSEYEEQINTNTITNINKYINKLIIIKSRVENLKNTGWFNSNGGHFRSKRITIPDYFKKYLTNLPYPLYVQDGTNIKKDDEWFNSILNYDIKKIYHGYMLVYKGLKKVKDNFGSHYRDYVIPIDSRNKIEKQIVLGYTYNNLYLNSNKSKVLENAKEYDNELELENTKDMKLYIFDFEYNLEDIITEKDILHVKKAYLKNINIVECIK